MIVLIILFTQISFAKFETIEKIIGNMPIAKPIFLVDGSQISQIDENNTIGYYEFTIRNYEGDSISETGFLYTIEIVSNTDESIQFELYNESEKVPLYNLKTEKIAISGNEKIDQKYKLKITYNELLGNQEKDIIEEVQIKVHSEQEKIG